MFKRTVFLLLEGSFICDVSHPEAYAFLSADHNFHAVNDYVSKIGRHVSPTSRQSGFFLTYASYGDEERSAIRSNYADIKNNLSSVVSFFNLVMKTTGQEDILMHGSVIEADSLIGVIDQDISLRNELQSLGARYKSTHDSQRKLLDSILQRLIKDGYLVLANPERSLYQVTAKIDYLLDVIRFISESDETLKIGDDPSVTETGTLL